MSMKVIYSFVVDQNPVFAYQAWHLAKSLRSHCAARPEEIHVQFTQNVTPEVIEVFSAEGYRTHAISTFGDAKWCNKLSQLPNLFAEDCDYILLLDTDMIAVADLRSFISGDCVQGKIVDCPNPSLATLRELYARAGGTSEPRLIATETENAQTFLGNANGGLYIVPAPLARHFSEEWRRWAEWLLANDEPLRREGKSGHVDQISVAFAVQLSGVPFSHAPSNVNYFIHFRGAHRYLDYDRPIALLHYHTAAMNVLGLIDPPIQLDEAETAAVAEANRLISSNFQNTLFWSYRYATHPERGSGLGSRGENLTYKRTLLKTHGVESAQSVLDVGCGDLEVLRELEIHNYLGLDVSQEALNKARAARPDWRFAILQAQPVEQSDMVICFEVLIHQSTREDYDKLLTFLVEHTGRTLIVSGYERKDDPRHMVHFYEPLSFSLARSKRFHSIQAIGAHTDVTVFRCDVEAAHDAGTLRGSMLSRLSRVYAHAGRNHRK